MFNADIVSGGAYYIVRNSGNRPLIVAQVPNGIFAQFTYYTVTVTAPEQQWFHLATTWKTEGNMKLYINGELEATVEPEGRISDFTGGTVILGAPRLRGYVGTNVVLDELHMFTHDMDESEIRKYSDVSYIRGET